MKTYKLIGAALIIISSANYVIADTSWLINGSFEYDIGGIGNIENQIPSGWDDVNVPDCFNGAVTSTWHPDRSYSLALYTGLEDLVAGEMIIVSQQLYLTDVNAIIFDIKLSTSPYYPSIPSTWWDPAKVAALVKIDEDIVWTSDDLGTGDLTDVYPDETVADINQPQYQDGEKHLFTLALQVKENIAWPDTQYYARWDYIGFDTHCRGGIGFLRTDFNQDCYIDEYDLALFCEHWLYETEDPNKYDLIDSNDVNFPDYAVFANDWMETSYGQDEEYLAFDKNLDGIVNFEDYAIITQQWQSEGINYQQLADFTDEWLATNWVYPPE